MKQFGWVRDSGKYIPLYLTEDYYFGNLWVRRPRPEREWGYETLIRWLSCSYYRYD